MGFPTSAVSFFTLRHLLHLHNAAHAPVISEKKCIVMERFLGWALRMSSPSKPLLHYHDVVIRQHVSRVNGCVKTIFIESLSLCICSKDYDTLADHCWLNDAILDFHMEYLDRNVISTDSKLKILLMRPGMVELIVHIQGKTTRIGWELG